MSHSFSLSRSRLIALLIIAALSFSAVTALAVYNASPAGAAKKSKKCKKGYKKVKGKCKKKKSTGSATVSSITIDSFQPSAYKATLKGTITLKKPVTSIKVTVTCSRQGFSRTTDTMIASDGAALSISYTADVTPGCIRMPGRGKIDYVASADGVKSKAY